MTTAWVRTVQALAWPTGNVLLATLNHGATLNRVRFSWGFSGWIPASANLSGPPANLQVFGLVTTAGTSPGTPPNARTGSSDVNPPSQRWLFWEARQPVLTSIDGNTDIAYYRDSGNQYEIDVGTQVTSKTLPAGQNVYLWASWAPAFTWHDEGFVQMWLSASILGEF